MESAVLQYIQVIQMMGLKAKNIQEKRRTESVHETKSVKPGLFRDKNKRVEGFLPFVKDRLNEYLENTFSI